MKNTLINFLAKLVGKVTIPQTGEELAKKLASPERVLIGKAIVQNLTNLPIGRLIDYFFVLNNWGGKNEIAIKIRDNLLDILDNLSQERIKVASFSDITFLCSYPEFKKVHYVLSGFESEITLDRNLVEDLFYRAHERRIDKEHRQSLLKHFKRSFTRFVSELEYDVIKTMIKKNEYPEEYLPIILSRAEELISSPEFSLGALRHMKVNYEEHSRCKMVVLLPIVKKYLVIKNSVELSSTQTLAEFFSKHLTADIFELDDVKNHLVTLLESVDDPAEIERIFEGRVEEIPNIALLLIYKRYKKILLQSMKNYKNDLTWLWERVWFCPFRGGLDILDDPIRQALKKTKAEIAWGVASRYWGKSQIEPYRAIARRKYIGWFSVRIRQEENIETLASWIEVGGKKSEKKILARVGQLWSKLSFDSLWNFSDISDKRLHRLRISMLRSKLSQFFKKEHSSEELRSVWGVLSPLTKKKARLFKKAFNPIFQGINWENLGTIDMDHVPYQFFKHFSRCLEKAVRTSLQDENINPVKMITQAYQLPNNLMWLRNEFLVEARKRISQMDISQLEGLLENKLLWYATKERYLELLPDIIATSDSEEYLDQRYQRCPQELRQEFIEILIAHTEAE